MDVLPYTHMMWEHYIIPPRRRSMVRMHAPYGKILGSCQVHPRNLYARVFSTIFGKITSHNLLELCQSTLHSLEEFHG